MRISYSQFVPIDGESYRQKELGSESLTYSNPRATQSIRDQLRRQTRPPALSSSLRKNADFRERS